ncbi:MAG: hypothetical protein IIA72_06040 [Proteobacteria bacterium]|nr:hypothetical protein [Pseudomonadota bacterium]
MARVSPIQTNFTAGELSPRLEGRVDISKYFNGARVLENMTIHPHGGASRRSGTRYVADVKDMTRKPRLIPFEFSTVQAYIVEAGHLYMRFFRNEGQIEDSPGVPTEIATPYAEADLFELEFAQSADVMYIVHPNYAPRKLERTSHTAWTLTVVDFADGPYREINTTGTTLTPSATSGAITITASASLFASTDVDRLVRIKHSSTWGYAKITGFNSATSVNADVKSNFGATTASSSWRLGAWSQTTSFPSCVTFYEERLFFAGSLDKPQTVWGSRSGDFENFAPTETDGVIGNDNGVTFTIATDQVNAIRWLSPGKVLAIGTTGGEFTMRATTADEPITPTNVQVKRETTRGCAYVLPIRNDGVVLFLQRAKRKIREFVFTFETDSFQSPDLTILAEHVTQGGLTQLAFAREPDPTVWAVRSDGVLLGMTYERTQDVVGWHRHILGGAFAGGDPVVESVAVIPSPNEDHDQLWVVVERTVNGATKRYVEFMEEQFDAGNDQADAFFVDSGLTYDGSATTTLTGLDHLEGETVAVLADGAVHPDRTVSAGAITLGAAVTKAQAGLAYRSKVQTMRFDAGAVDGTSQGKKSRIHEVTVRLWNTLGAKLGFDDDVDTIVFRGASDPMDSAPPLFTGDKKIKFNKGYSTSPRVTVIQDQPLPLTVLSIMPRMVTFDG